MKYISNHIRFGDPDFKFTRIKHGYNPEEVDAVIETKLREVDTLTKQNADLINENSRLNQALDECKIKIQQITQSTRLIERERRKEKLRLADIMITAGRIAEETVADARCKAVEIITEANLVADHLVQQAEAEAEEAYKELVTLKEIIQTTHESCNRHFSWLDEVMQSVTLLHDNKL